MKPCLLFLTCANDREAEKIAVSLLDKKLVVCTKRTNVKSAYRWKNKIEKANEVLLIMDSVEENFKKVEKEVAKLHSYDTFVLTSSPVTQVSKNVKNWLENGLETA